MAINERQFTAKVVNAYALTANATEKDFDLALYIVRNYYDVATYFPNREGDFESGINLQALQTFADCMTRTLSAIRGEVA
jgi:hypothetical protein